MLVPSPEARFSVSMVARYANGDSSGVTYSASPSHSGQWTAR